MKKRPFKPLDPAVLRAKVQIFLALFRQTAVIRRLNADLRAANQALADNFLVVNNIVVHNLHLGIYEYGQTGLHNRFLNNLVYANPINLLLQHGNRGQGTIVADPRFVNFKIDGSGDYHLAAGSPAIGTGTSTGEPTNDLDGFSRTIVTAVDLGPYAYRSNNASRRHILKKLH